MNIRTCPLNMPIFIIIISILCLREDLPLIAPASLLTASPIIYTSNNSRLDCYNLSCSQRLTLILQYTAHRCQLSVVVSIAPKVAYIALLYPLSILVYMPCSSKEGYGHSQALLSEQLGTKRVRFSNLLKASFNLVSDFDEKNGTITRSLRYIYEIISSTNKLVAIDIVLLKDVILHFDLGKERLCVALRKKLSQQ